MNKKFKPCNIYYSVLYSIFILNMLKQYNENNREKRDKQRKENKAIILNNFEAYIEHIKEANTILPF